MVSSAYIAVRRCRFSVGATNEHTSSPTLQQLLAMLFRTLSYRMNWRGRGAGLRVILTRKKSNIPVGFAKAKGIGCTVWL